MYKYVSNTSKIPKNNCSYYFKNARTVEFDQKNHLDLIQMDILLLWGMIKKAKFQKAEGDLGNA